MASKLEAFAKKQGVKYFLVNFTDLFGVQRSKLVPATAIAGMEEEGAGFAGFASYLDMTPAHPDMYAVPDPASVIQLPWKPEVAWVAGDLVMEGRPVEQAPRVILKRMIETAKAAGYVMKTGVEAEYHLISADGLSISDDADIAGKPCYDQQALMRRYDVISEICDAMIGLDWGPYQNDHEDANGQFEMNWDYADALTTADRHAFFRFMTKSIAEKHGLRATFMPKPFTHLTGNGCHVHVSVWDKAGKKNLFADKKGELGLSALGYNFLGGLLRSATALCAITNPTVNSYKRINAPVTASGGDLGTEHSDLWRQQPHPHGSHSRCRALRVPIAGWRHQPLSVARRRTCRRPRRDRDQG